MNEALECDTLEVGSGAAGLAAAATASALNLRVIVCEQADVIGGTTALSGGEVWIPMSRQAGGDAVDSAEAALEYLVNVAGDYLDRDRAAAYIAEALVALAFLEDHSHLEYELMQGVVDYSSDLPGATTGQRSLGATPFDGRQLGEDFNRLRPPLPTSLIFGGMALSREDVPHFSAFLRSPRSALRVARLLVRHLRDRIAGYPRGTRLVMSNALVGRLLKTLAERNVSVLTNTVVSRLYVYDGRVGGALLICDGAEMRIDAAKAVIVASGGCSGSERMRKRYFDHVKTGRPHLSPVPAANDGSGIELVLSCGGVLNSRVAQPAAWTPASVVATDGGEPAFFPHFGDRAKPGVIVVNTSGRRFANGALNYHEFTKAMLNFTASDGATEFFILTSHRHLRKYGLGRVPPFPGRLSPFLRSGYLVREGSIKRLAEALGIDPQNLVDTVASYDDNATRGEDPTFGKGSTEYQRAAGDAENRPNPCVAPLGQGPYYAIRIQPGDIGTMLGVSVNTRAQALDQEGMPIPGLFAVGTVAAALAAGSYPGAGANLGPAITAGYVAARTIAEERISSTESGTIDDTAPSAVPLAAT